MSQELSEKELQVLLEKAKDIAKKAHAGMTDKGGNPYIEHPIRIMEKMTTLPRKIVGVLHDTIEDTWVTAEYLLQEGFPQSIVNSILAVTRRKDETYMEFVKRAMEDPDGGPVKLEDLLDNSDLSRIPNHTQEDIDRVNKRYKPAIQLAKQLMKE